MIGPHFSLVFILGIDERIPHSSQAIVTSYEFQCCGTIKEWGAGISSGVFDEFDIKFQVWRPSPTVDRGGCYSLVGENEVTSTRAFPAGIIEQTPSVAQRIVVQPGDVVGFRMEGENLSNDAGVLLESSDLRQTVWYGDVEVGPSNCPYTVDSSRRKSVNLRPLIRISLGK